MEKGSVTSQKTEQQLAEFVASAMSKDDAFGRLLGMRLVQIEPGRAIVSLQVTEDLVNGLGICHGGVTFSLADTAFAYACNSRNQRTVALGCSISFTRAVSIGETLTATAQEQILNGKTGIYDITICNQSDEVVALFRGTSYRLNAAAVEQSSSGLS